MIPSSTTYTPYVMVTVFIRHPYLVQVPDKMARPPHDAKQIEARYGSHRPTQSKSKPDTSLYIFTKVIYGLYVVLTCNRLIASQLQARSHPWASASELHCSQRGWGVFFISLENHEQYAYRQQKRPFLFIYTQQWLPKARFEKKIEGVYLKIFSTN